MTGPTPHIVRPLDPTRVERIAASVVRVAVALPGLRRVLLSRVISAPGYGVATACGFLWGTLLGGRHRRSHGLHIISRLPRWAFGRGGTTVGAVFLTRGDAPDRVLEHEAVHKQQWRHYGLALPVLYLAAGHIAQTNRFEVEAGLAKGGYRSVG